MSRWNDFSRVCFIVSGESERQLRDPFLARDDFLVFGCHVFEKKKNLHIKSALFLFQSACYCCPIKVYSQREAF